MAIARSRITAQGQVSVPAEVRRKLGAGPGTVLEWDEEDGAIVVRRKGRFSSLLAQIPVAVVTDPLVGIRGALAIAKEVVER